MVVSDCRAILLADVTDRDTRFDRTLRCLDWVVVAADSDDGSHAADHCAVCRAKLCGVGLAGLFLRSESVGRGWRMSIGWFVFAANPRRLRRHFCRRFDQSVCGHHRRNVGLRLRGARLVDRSDLRSNLPEPTIELVRSTVPDTVLEYRVMIPSGVPLSRSELILIQLVIALSGLTALGAEVVWTRHLGLLLGPTVYTFSIILGVFLLGMGLGSGVGAWLGRRVRSPALTLAMTQLLLMLAIPYAAILIVQVVPNWLTLHGTNELFTVRVTRDVIRILVTILPATCLWGASFPLAVAVVAGREREPGRTVGGLSAANTAGAIAGSLAVSLLAIPYGAQFVQQGLTAICGFAGLLLVCWIVWPRRSSSVQVTGTCARRGTSLAGSGLLSVFAVILVCGMAVWSVPSTPNRLLADGRLMNHWIDRSHYRYVAEGLDSAIVVSDLADGTRCFHVAGKIEASTRERDRRTQRLLGHLPAMVHPQAKKVLVIGCGTGMTAGSFLVHPSIDEIVLCEMEKCVIEAARENFSAYNGGVLDQARTRIVCDDARHFLATTQETFDIITADPIHPWVKGAASLYTSEFFQMCKKRLNRNGVVTLWVPLYESNEATVKCGMATFLQQFPMATIWSGQSHRVGYDLVIVGQVNGEPVRIDEMAAQLDANVALQLSLAEVGIGTMQAVVHRFVARGSDLSAWLTGAQINRDCNLRLQYLAGTSPDHASEQEILQAMLPQSQLTTDPSSGLARTTTCRWPACSLCLGMTAWRGCKSGPIDSPDHRRNRQMNGVTPGRASGCISILVSQLVISGMSTCLEFMAISHVTCLPV